MRNSNIRYIITGGHAYTDIDVLACAIGYQNFLSLSGYEAKATLCAPFNATIPKIVTDQPFNYSNTYKPQPNDAYVIVDVSDPNFIEPFASEYKIIELFDHHFGNEEYWKKRLGKNAHIEPVGSCATLIWECFTEAGISKKIDPISANLLYISIVANTLNLQAQVTSIRDRNSLEELEQYVTLPKDWRDLYYAQISKDLIDDPIRFVQRDLKTVSFGDKEYKIGQLELWDGSDFAFSPIFRKKICKEFSSSCWFVILSSIKECKSYLLTDRRDLQDELSKILGVRWIENGLGETHRLWMRKEILREYASYFKSIASVVT